MEGIGVGGGVGRGHGRNRCGRGCALNNKVFIHKKNTGLDVKLNY